MVAALTTLAFPALAAAHRVAMLNQGKDGVTVLAPRLVQAEVGETITVIPTSNSQDVVSLPGMLAKGVAAFASKPGERFVLTSHKPGLYAGRCKPHLTRGMVSRIRVVGDAAHCDAIANGKLPTRAPARMDGDLALLGR